MEWIVLGCSAIAVLLCVFICMQMRSLTKRGQDDSLRQELQREYHVLDDVMQNETGDK